MFADAQSLTGLSMHTLDRARAKLVVRFFLRDPACDAVRLGPPTIRTSAPSGVSIVASEASSSPSVWRRTRFGGAGAGAGGAPTWLGGAAGAGASVSMAAAGVAPSVGSTSAGAGAGAGAAGTGASVSMAVGCSAAVAAGRQRGRRVGVHGCGGGRRGHRPRRRVLRRRWRAGLRGRRGRRACLCFVRGGALVAGAGDGLLPRRRRSPLLLSFFRCVLTRSKRYNSYSLARLRDPRF